MQWAGADQPFWSIAGKAWDALRHERLARQWEEALVMPSAQAARPPIVRVSGHAQAELGPGEVRVFDWTRLAFRCAVAGELSLRRTTLREAQRSAALVPLRTEHDLLMFAHRRARPGRRRRQSTRTGKNLGSTPPGGEGRSASSGWPSAPPPLSLLAQPRSRDAGEHGQTTQQERSARRGPGQPPWIGRSVGLALSRQHLRRSLAQWGAQGNAVLAMAISRRPVAWCAGTTAGTPAGAGPARVIQG
jgi:hypothetical protein